MQTVATSNAVHHRRASRICTCVSRWRAFLASAKGHTSCSTLAMFSSISMRLAMPDYCTQAWETVSIPAPLSLVVTILRAFDHEVHNIPIPIKMAALETQPIGDQKPENTLKPEQRFELNVPQGYLAALLSNFATLSQHDWTSLLPKLLMSNVRSKSQILNSLEVIAPKPSSAIATAGASWWMSSSINFKWQNPVLE